MNILSFEKFKLLLEAEGDEPAPAASETPAPPATPAETPATAPPATPAETPATAPPATDVAAAAASQLASLGLPPDPNSQTAPAATGVSMKVVFIDEDEPWHSQYSEGGGVKRFKEYEFTQPDLEKWITDSKLDTKKDSIIQAVNGKSSIDNDTFKKLKSALSSKKFGKDRGDVDIDFDEKNSPSTAKLDLIFVKSS